MTQHNTDVIDPSRLYRVRYPNADENTKGRPLFDVGGQHAASEAQKWANYRGSSLYICDGKGEDALVVATVDPDVTDDDINALRSSAVESRDEALVDTCDRALRRQLSARKTLVDRILKDRAS